MVAHAGLLGLSPVSRAICTGSCDDASQSALERVELAILLPPQCSAGAGGSRFELRSSLMLSTADDRWFFCSHSTGVNGTEVD